jgi:hypothetical protein
MPTFTVTFDTDNAAFSEDSGGDMSQEIARILRNLAGKVEENSLVEGVEQRIRDINGNRVGFAVLQGEAS